MSLKVNEIYFSIQGESTHTGRPCIFIRLTYCNLRCIYCDTEYAFYKGKDMEISEIMTNIKQWNCRLVEVTGGEPLFQDECIELLNEILKENYEVMLETGGSLPIYKVPEEIIKIVDFKCPSSGMKKHNLWSIVNDLMAHDEVKFVIGDRQDYDWCKSVLEQYDLCSKAIPLMGVIFGRLEVQQLVEWIVEDRLPVRLQLQMHKYIWDPSARAV